MLKIITKALLIGLLAMPIVSVKAASVQAEEKEQGSWQLRKQQDGITVFVRGTEKVGGLKEFKGIALMKARMETVAELMRDIPAATQWMADTEVADVIHATDDYNYRVHNVTSMPWPVSDREMVVDISVEMNYPKGRADIHMNALDPAPYSDLLDGDRVYMDSSHVVYTLQYIDREHTQVTYFASLNIGGSVPAYLGNLVIVDIPFTTLGNMRKMLKKPKYIEAGKQSVDRLKIEQALLEHPLTEQSAAQPTNNKE
ncbi:hypothetical protein [Pelagibaculum spongiae]|uniref:START domain-containing protein n=1 Tax=Pelagibaculum spongiae TaxID=2080658 RepID=A0A2V1GXL5_9GAMM|nr:hypothetical protein [Pelagibaculum spongiae]PVZ66384.1 hypothetical protein DC094_16960 [Pelagibaculum spongiae]